MSPGGWFAGSESRHVSVNFTAVIDIGGNFKWRGTMGHMWGSFLGHGRQGTGPWVGTTKANVG